MKFSAIRTSRLGYATKAIVLFVVALSFILGSFAPVFATNPITTKTRFDWQNSSGEIKGLRTYATKDFIDPSNSKQRIRIQSSGLLHAYTDRGFQDIEKELPSYGFPEGKVLSIPASLQYIMDLPSWGTARVEDGGKTVRVYDKQGVSIFKYTNPVVIETGKAPFKVVDEKGIKVRDAFSEIGLGINERIVNSANVDLASFAITAENKLYLLLPDTLKNKYPLQAYDATDTASTNNKDTFMQSNNADTNYGTGDIVQTYWAETGSIKHRGIFEWTLSSGTGTISKISFFGYVVFGGGAYQVDLHELTRAFTEAGATWNKYDGTNAWTTAGGDYSATIVDSAPDTGGWDEYVLLGEGATNPITELTWGNTVDFLLKHNPESGATTKQIQYGTKEHATPGYRPYIEITYTPPAPTVTTSAASSIEATTATLNGSIDSLSGGSNCTRHGFGWDVHTHTNWNDYANDVGTNGDFGVGNFSDAATSLPTGTTIYCRAYATNNLGTGQGAEVTFLTKPAAPTNVAATDGTQTTKVVITWTKSTGATDYQVYRNGNALGWAGDVATFDDTGAGAPVITPGTASATDGTDTAKVVLSVAGESAANGTTHTYKVRAKNATGESVDSGTDTGYRGTTTLTYQWRVSANDSDASFSNIDGGTTDPYNYTTAPAPTITAGTASASDGTSNLHVVLSIAGESANSGAGRYYYCIISMTGATNADTTHDRGYRSVGTLTYQWQRSAGDSDASYSNISGATTDPYNDTGGVVDPDGRYYKCVLNATGATQQTTNADRGYIAAAVPPTVTTLACTGFTKYEAVVNGIMVDDNVAAATKYGFSYGLTSACGTEVEVTKILADGTPFWMNLTGLLPATVYYYKAKAYSTEGWGYGSVMQFSTKGSPTLYEKLNTGQDSHSDEIYGVNWGYMQFTVGSISHTATSINLYIKRVTTPDVVTVSLRHASGGLPTGNDLVSTTFNGDSISTDYVMYNFPIAETTLEAGQQYAIVVRAIAGDAAKYILWGKDSGDGGLANAAYGTSINGGLSFVSQTPVDVLFEIWGNPCIEVVGAKVFTGYKQANDWLIVADVSNVYVPYFPDSDPQLYFQLQLISGSTIKGTANFRAWQRQPLSIYLNAGTSSALSWGSAYKIRIQALFSDTVLAEYALVSGDWNAGSLLYLDSYVRTLASTYETYYNTAYLSSTAGQTERVLNEAGSIVFIRGIAGLETVRPDLFYTSFGISKPGVTPHTLLVPNPQAALGADVYGRVNEVATLLGVDAVMIIGWTLAGLALLIGIGCVGVGHGVAGLIIGLFFAGGAGFVFGGIPIAVLGVIGFVFLMLIAIWLGKLLFSPG